MAYSSESDDDLPVIDVILRKHLKRNLTQDKKSKRRRVVDDDAEEITVR